MGSPKIRQLIEAQEARATELQKFIAGVDRQRADRVLEGKPDTDLIADRARMCAELEGIPVILETLKARLKEAEREEAIASYDDLLKRIGKHEAKLKELGEAMAPLEKKLKPLAEQKLELEREYRTLQYNASQTMQRLQTAYGPLQLSPMGEKVDA
jgi:uncharacterized protein (DUF342 family)